MRQHPPYLCTRDELCEQARAVAVCSVRFASREAKPGGKDVPQVRADGHVSMCPVWPQVLKCAHDNLQTADVRSRAAALHTEGVAHARSRTSGRARQDDDKSWLFCSIRELGVRVIDARSAGHATPRG